MRSLQPLTSSSRDQSPTRSDISNKTHRSSAQSVHSSRADPSLSHKTSGTRLRVTPRISSSHLRSSNNNKQQQTTSTSTQNTNSIPASSYLQPTLASNSRTPLRNKDQNALSQTRALPPTAAGTATKTKRKPTSNMPPTHDNKGGNATPRQPVLSAKPLGRPPLTPKIATSKSQSSLHHQQQQQPNVTPLARRKTDNTTTPSAHDVSSPAVAATLMGNHITPRSGSRQTRVDSANSTPTGTPNPERNSEFEADPTKRHLVTFSQPASSPAASANARSNNDNPDAKFFYASDAKTGGPPQQQQHAQPVRPTMPQKSSGSTFMYANAMDRNRPTSPGVSSGFTPMLAPAQESQASKFFYANGQPNLQPNNVRPSSSASGAGSAISASAKTTGPRISSNVPGGATSGTGTNSRPMSPNKMSTMQSATSSQVSKSQPPYQTQTANRSSQVGSPPSLGPPPNGKRRFSIENGQQSTSHSRGGSVGSGDAMIMSKFMATQPAQPTQGASQASSEASSPMPANSAMTMASIIQAAEDLPPESDESKGQSELQSPTKSHAGDPLNEAVANARRERKVQDLEIRNASLEAINRSLERQLRKQTAELRRYRRLSRSGRFSFASAGSHRIPSDSTVATSTTADGGVALSDLSEEDELFDDEEEEDEDDSMYDSEPSDAESLTSPGLKRTKRDEKRLQLDLSKHRELLVDSQKINQSIKRCLNWTEELINEGKKSLSYNVRVSDMELAPRVLAPQYDDDDEDVTTEIEVTSGDIDTSNVTFSAAGEDDIREALAGLGIDESNLAFLAPAESTEKTEDAETTAEKPQEETELAESTEPPAPSEPPGEAKGEDASLTDTTNKPPQERDSGVELTTEGGGG